MQNTLKTYGVPEALEHGDLNIKNIIYNESIDHPYMIDLGEANFSNPIFSYINLRISMITRLGFQEQDLEEYDDFVKHLASDWIPSHKYDSYYSLLIKSSFIRYIVLTNRILNIDPEHQDKSFYATRIQNMLVKMLD